MSSPLKEPQVMVGLGVRPRVWSPKPRAPSRRARRGHAWQPPSP